MLLMTPRSFDVSQVRLEEIQAAGNSDNEDENYTYMFSAAHSSVMRAVIEEEKQHAPFISTIETHDPHI